MKFDMIVLGVSSSCDALNWAIARPFFLIVVSALSKKVQKLVLNEPLYINEEYAKVILLVWICKILKNLGSQIIVLILKISKNIQQSPKLY